MDIRLQTSTGSVDVHYMYIKIVWIITTKMALKRVPNEAEYHSVNLLKQQDIFTICHKSLEHQPIIN